MNEKQVERSFRYAAAAAIAIGGIIMTDVFRRVGNPQSFPLLLAAILLSAWYGGVGPGALAAVISCIAASRLPTLRSSGVHVGLSLAAFMAESIVAIVLGSLIRRVTLIAGASRPRIVARGDRTDLSAWPHDNSGGPLNPFIIRLKTLLRRRRISESIRAEGLKTSPRIEMEMGLLDDPSDLTNSQGKKICTEILRINLHEPLQDATQACEPELMERQIALDVHFAASSPYVLEDSVRLEQMFRNVIECVMRFVPVGGSISVRTSNQTDGRLSLEFRGRGPSNDDAPAFMSPELAALACVPRLAEPLDDSCPDSSASRPLPNLDDGPASFAAINVGIVATFIVSLPTTARDIKKYAGNDWINSQLPSGLSSDQNL